MVVAVHILKCTLYASLYSKCTGALIYENFCKVTVILNKLYMVRERSITKP